MFNIRQQLILPISLFACSVVAFAQKYKIYSAPDSYGLGPLAVYEFYPLKQVTDFLYSHIDIVADSYFIVTEYDDNSAQLLSSTLKVIIPKGKFSSIHMDPENLNFAVVTGPDANPKDDIKPPYGIYDIKQSKLVVPCKYSYIGHINVNGIVPFNKGGKDMMPQLVQGGKWGYMSIDGKEILTPKYTWCSTLNNKNCGTAYIGGNSEDGLYGGYWTLIDQTGQILIDDTKYYYPEKDPYNEAPEEFVTLRRKTNRDGPNNILASCDGKTVKEINYEVDRIFGEDKMIAVSPKDGSSENMHGIIDLNEKVIVPLTYGYITKIGNTFLFNDASDELCYLDKATKEVKKVGIRDNKKLEYDHKEKRTNTDSYWGSGVTWLLYGKDDKGKYSFYDLQFKKVLAEVDSGDGWSGGFSTGFKDELGTYFLFYSRGMVNYYSSNLGLVIPENYMKLQPTFADCVYGKNRTDSAYAFKNGKWGLISTKTFKGNNFMYDEIRIIDKNYAIVKKGGHYFVSKERKIDLKLGAFDQVIWAGETNRPIADQKGYFHPENHIIAKRKGTTCLVRMSSGFWVNGEFDAYVSDSGKIEKIDGDRYLKNGTWHALWTHAALPKSIEDYLFLDEWSEKNKHDLVYAYKQNGLWGIIDENGKILKAASYKTREELPPPPGEPEQKNKKSK